MDIVHLMPRIVPDIMVLQGISFETIIDGVFLNIARSKRKCWQNFPLNLGFLTVQNSTHVALLGKEIVEMKVAYVHQEHPDDSIYRGTIDLLEVLRNILTPEELTFIFQYQKELNTRVLHFRQIQLTVEENV